MIFLNSSLCRSGNYFVLFQLKNYHFGPNKCKIVLGQCLTSRSTPFPVFSTKFFLTKMTQIFSYLLPSTLGSHQPVEKIEINFLSVYRWNLLETGPEDKDVRLKFSFSNEMLNIVIEQNISSELVRSNSAFLLM